MKILIAGDSYSDCTDFRRKEYKLPYYSWISLLSQTYDVTCIGRGASSMFDIKRSLKAQDLTQYSFIVINFTAVTRWARYELLARHIPPREMEHIVSRSVPTSDLIAVNLKLGKSIVSTPRTICWTPFPGWDTIEGVTEIFQYSEDEFWWLEDEERRFSTVTGNHLTKQGNDELFKIMKTRIEREVNT